MRLTKTDRNLLAAHEAVIERGLTTFIEVGAALLDIRDRRLYREHYDTFEAYCRERWGIARRTAYQLVDAAIVVENVRHGAQIPANERQVRPLTKLEPEQQKEAWQKAVETAPGGKITGAHVAHVVQEYRNGSSPAGSTSIISIGDEYYTPQYIIDAARAVMGGIDLDPASCPVANQVVGAAHYYTRLDNGLPKRWAGRVWLNPPFSFPNPFISKVIEEYTAGNVSQAVVLVNNGTETTWGQSLLSRYVVCFASTRISFWHGDPAEPIKGNRYAQMLFYLGPHPERFRAEFGQLGAILEPHYV